MSSWEDEASFFNLFTLTLFNIFDTIGRFSASVKCMKLSRKASLWLNYLRSFFLITFMLVAFEIGPEWLFCSDWFKLLNMSLFAFTNGWLSSICIILTPEYIKQGDLGEIGGLFNVAIVGGITIGTVLAICIEPVIKASPKGQIQ